MSAEDDGTSIDNETTEQTLIIRVPMNPMGASATDLSWERNYKEAKFSGRNTHD